MSSETSAPAAADPTLQEPATKKSKSGDEAPAPAPTTPAPAPATAPEPAPAEAASAVSPSVPQQAQAAAAAGKTLYQLLRIEEEDTLTERQIAARFDEIARHLLLKCIVMVGNVPHRFTELEFYYNGKAHKDIFTHGDPIQKSCGQWYFHKTGKNYKGGSYKGMDLTFAGPDVFGGILVRGMRKLDAPRDYLDGPCIVVDHVLKMTKADTIAAFVEREGTIVAVPGEASDTKVCPNLFVKEGDNGCKATDVIVKTPRVGLVPRGDEKEKFVMREYRYLTEPKECKKGRPFTILGMHRLNKSAADISTALGSPKTTVQKYIDLFESGKKLTSGSKFQGATLGTDACCSYYGFCTQKGWI